MHIEDTWGKEKVNATCFPGVLLLLCNRTLLYCVVHLAAMWGRHPWVGPPPTPDARLPLSLLASVPTYTMGSRVALFRRAPFQGENQETGAT